jgi:hypothetical protein
VTSKRIYTSEPTDGSDEGEGATVSIIIPEAWES